jgi:hypothetical protein
VSDAVILYKAVTVQGIKIYGREKVKLYPTVTMTVHRGERLVSHISWSTAKERELLHPSDMKQKSSSGENYNDLHLRGQGTQSGEACRQDSPPDEVPKEKEDFQWTAHFHPRKHSIY